MLFNEQSWHFEFLLTSRIDWIGMELSPTLTVVAAHTGPKNPVSVLTVIVDGWWSILLFWNLHSSSWYHLWSQFTWIHIFFLWMLYDGEMYISIHYISSLVPDLFVLCSMPPMTMTIGVGYCTVQTDLGAVYRPQFDNTTRFWLSNQ